MHKSTNIKHCQETGMVWRENNFESIHLETFAGGRYPSEYLKIGWEFV